MWPTLLAPPTFPVVVPAYPVALVATVLLGIGASLFLAHRLAQLPVGRVAIALLLLTGAALAGARVHFLVANPTLAPPGWRALVFWGGGVHAAGGIAGLLLAAPLVSRLLRLPVAAFADCLAPAAALSLAMHRVACWLRGCCFGTICPYPWCLSYPHGSFAFIFHAQASAVTSADRASAPVHPLPLYYLGASLVIMLFGLWWYPRRRYPGEVALWTLLSFASSTLLLEPYRAVTETTRFIGPWPQLTLAAALLAGCALLLIAGAERVRYRRRVPPRASPDGHSPSHR